MQSSAIHTFVSIGNDLVTLLAQLKFTTLEQLEEGTGPGVVAQLYKGRLSNWYSMNHMKIIATAQAILKPGSNIASIGKITVSAYNSNSGMSRLTKGAGFATYVELIQLAMTEIGKAELGDRIVNDLAAIDLQIKGFTQSSVARSTAQRDVSLVSTQRSAANALYELVLSDIADETTRHELREQTKRADNKLTALKVLINAG